jgi:hypothetical protein
VTWLCFSDGPRLVGRLPGVGHESWFSATSLEPAADLSELSLRDLSLAMALGSGRSTLRAAEARVVGLPSWGAPRAPRKVLDALRLGLGVEVEDGRPARLEMLPITLEGGTVKHADPLLARDMMARMRALCARTGAAPESVGDRLLLSV